MNKLIIGVNALLICAVVYLFYKVEASPEKLPEETNSAPEAIVAEKVKEVQSTQQLGNVPTGKIAYVNIDRLNEESTEIADLVAETKRRKESIEGNVESLSMKYQTKVEEFQLLQKGGIAPKSELEAKAREIQSIEKEAQNKQLQMDQLSAEIGEKNSRFQQRVRDFLLKWNNGRYDFIFSYSEAVPTMLLGNTSLEITEEIISEINKDYKLRRAKK